MHGYGYYPTVPHPFPVCYPPQVQEASGSRSSSNRPPSPIDYALAPFPHPNPQPFPYATYPPHPQSAYQASSGEAYTISYLQKRPADGPPNNVPQPPAKRGRGGGSGRGGRGSGGRSKRTAQAPTAAASTTLPVGNQAPVPQQPRNPPPMENSIFRQSQMRMSRKNMASPSSVWSFTASYNPDVASSLISEVDPYEARSTRPSDENGATRLRCRLCRGSVGVSPCSHFILTFPAETTQRIGRIIRLQTPPARSISVHTTHRPGRT